MVSYVSVKFLAKERSGKLREIARSTEATRDISLKFDNDAARKVDSRNQVVEPRVRRRVMHRRVTADHNDRERIVARRRSGYVDDAYNG